MSGVILALPTLPYAFMACTETSFTCFNNKNLCILPTQCTCLFISYDSHNKELLFP